MNLMNARGRRPAETSEGDDRLYPACQDCGVAVTDADAVLETLHAEGFTTLLGRQQIPHTVERPQDVTVSRCPACETRRHRAAELVDAHPGAVPYLRYRPHRVNVANNTLVVFDLLGQSWRELLDEGTDREVNHVIDSLFRAGGGLAYSNNITPRVLPGFGDGVPATATTRWAHVSPSARQDARDAYSGLLADRTDGPREVPPPDSDGFNDAMRGCLFCGVRAVTAPSRRRVWGIWGDMHRVTASVLGGPGEPGYRRGYLCPTCRTSVERVGAIGMNALEQTLAVHLGVKLEVFDRYDRYDPVDKIEYDGLRLAGLKAWCALPVGTPPNAKPWAHLGDLTELAEALRKL